jgi:predicted DNA-binding transcriptional regulator AlpA
MSNTETTTKRGRKPGSKNTPRPLPAVIHPQQMLSVADMAELSGMSRSFFETNLSLARSGRRHTTMPPVVKVGRNVRCKAEDFFAWMGATTQPAAA